MNDLRFANIIGRKRELEVLGQVLESDRSEFVAIYGRRRVGKSFLISEFFDNKFSFSVVGSYLKENDEATYRQTQLSHFYDQLLAFGLNANAPRITCWREAFSSLKQLLLRKRSKRKVVFIDELPWLAGPQSSELISELGYFWNSWAERQKNIVLVVCGSATSWMLDNIIRDYGGLYGRLTQRIKLSPFTLGECEQFYKSRGFKFSRYEIALSYMVWGGIPYYMNMLKRNLSLTQNINNLFFGVDNYEEEFKSVYTGLYSSTDRYIYIVMALGKRFYGLTRSEIQKSIQVSSGGTLTKMLDNLLESGVIRQYPRYGKSRVETVFQLKDYFSLFYLRFIYGKSQLGSWNMINRSGNFYSWAGNTFELLCIDHIPQILSALRLRGVRNVYCYSGTASSGREAQIDLVFESEGERADYICEIKFSENQFAIDVDYESKLSDKIDAFLHSKQHKPTRSLLLVMIVANGLSKNEHSHQVDEVVTLDDLFSE